MSATSPFGPAYDEQPEDGQRSGSGQWRPRAGGPQGAQGDSGQFQGESYSPGRGAPGQGSPGQGAPGQGGYGRGGQPGSPQPGQRPMPQAGRPSPEPRGGIPRAGGPAAGGPAAGGPSAGRGQQPGQYQSPQQQYSPQSGGYASPSGPVTGSSPRADQRSAGSPPRREPGPSPRGAEYRPQAEGAPSAEVPVQDQPFEEAAFTDRSRDDWGGGNETTAIGRLGYMPKEPRRRSDFQKVRSRARKSSPWPKIIAAIVALGLVGGGAWWFMNRPAEEDSGTAAASGLTYAGSEEPCSLVDAGELESIVDGTEPVASAEGEQKSRGWVQSCSLTYGEPEQAAALLEIEGTVFDSDSKASVNFDLGTREIGEMTEPWTVVDPAPAVGDQATAVARIPEEPGTSNYQLHLQDDNVYLVVRLSVAEGAGLDQQGLTDLTTALANAYLENWRDAS